MSKSLNSLARTITLKGSRQTFFTILFLVDKPLVPSCFQAYAYFRWLDDRVDDQTSSFEEGRKIIKRQRMLINRAYKDLPVVANSVEEQLVINLIKNDPKTNPRLESFVRNFLAIIEFDIKRRDKRITTKQLDWYTDTLAKAVTDCIEYFVGNKTDYLDSKFHYSAALAAHLTHILRDYKEDILLGYYNLPKGTDESDWVKQTVKKAKIEFKNGKKYISSPQGFRIKLVAYLYCARFEWILRVIEKDKYSLRKQYNHKTHFSNLYNFFWIFANQSYQHFFKL